MFVPSRTTFTRTLAVLLAAGFLATSAHAAIITYNLNIEFSGATPPAGAAPWIRAELDDGGGSGSVTMTLTALNLVGTEFVRYWYFNLDPSLNPTSLVFSAPIKTGVFDDPTIVKGVNAFQADGDGLYDVRVDFSNAPPGTRFTAGDSVEYTITGIPTLTANSFHFLSAPAGPNGPFYVAAHVQGIGSSGNLSGWITEVPEPTSFTIFGIVAAAIFRRRR